MDWLMLDGSIFRTKAVFEDDTDETVCYTSVTAVVEDKAFAGRVDVAPEDLKMGDLLTLMSEVPIENVHPCCPAGFLICPNSSNFQLHYLKSPSFEWEDAQSGRSFVADRLLSEATFYEILRQRPHPNIAQYLGCVVDNGRIKKLCLRRYSCNIMDLLEGERSVSDADVERLLFQIISAVRHLHRLGYAHNDINAYDVCMTSEGDAVLIDFDSCERLGAPVMKGGQFGWIRERFISDEQNDWQAIGLLDRALRLLTAAQEGDKTEDDDDDGE